MASMDGRRAERSKASDRSERIEAAGVNRHGAASAKAPRRPQAQRRRQRNDVMRMFTAAPSNGTIRVGLGRLEYPRACEGDNLLPLSGMSH